MVSCLVRIAATDRSPAGTAHKPWLRWPARRRECQWVSINGGSPKMMIYNGWFHGKSHLYLDDDWGDPHSWKPPYVFSRFNHFCWDDPNSRWECVSLIPLLLDISLESSMTTCSLSHAWQFNVRFVWWKSSFLLVTTTSVADKTACLSHLNC